MSRRVAWLTWAACTLILLLALACDVRAEELGQTIVEPDALKAATSLDTWASYERVWAEGTEPEDNPAAMAQYRVGLGRWSVFGRLQWSGVAGKFDPNRIETVRAGQLYLGLSRNVARAAGVTFAPSLLFGAAATLETVGGIRATFERRVTAGAGFEALAPGWSAGLYAGQHWSLSGFGVGAHWSVRLAGSPAGKAGEMRSLGLVLCDLTGRARVCVASTAVAVRVK